MKFLSSMFTLAICTFFNGYTQVNIKNLLIQSYHTTCVSFSCEFSRYLRTPASVTQCRYVSAPRLGNSSGSISGRDIPKSIEWY